MNLRSLQKILKPYHRRITNLLARGVVRLVDASTFMQSIQLSVLSGELLDNVEHFEPYGFTAHPHAGAEALVASLGGNRSHAVVISIADRQFRLRELAPGEVALYTDEGDSIVLRRGNNIELNATTQVTINSPVAHFSGNITADGDISDANGSMQDMRGTYNTHTHSNPEGGSVGPAVGQM
ncbi:MAG TPA: phage baseplate assembly protein V [Gammaproteobacteria bacterium]